MVNLPCGTSLCLVTCVAFRPGERVLTLLAARDILLDHMFHATPNAPTTLLQRNPRLGLPGPPESPKSEASCGYDSLADRLHLDAKSLTERGSRETLQTIS